jgi:hypothetical protein
MIPPRSIATPIVIFYPQRPKTSGAMGNFLTLRNPKQTDETPALPAEEAEEEEDEEPLWAELAVKALPHRWWNPTFDVHLRLQNGLWEGFSGMTVRQVRECDLGDKDDDVWGDLTVVNHTYTKTEEGLERLCEDIDAFLKEHAKLMSETKTLHMKEGPATHVSERTLLEAKKKHKERILDTLEEFIDGWSLSKLTAEMRWIIRYWEDKFNFPHSPAMIEHFEFVEVVVTGVLLGRKGMVDKERNLKFEWYYRLQLYMWKMGVDLPDREMLVVRESPFAYKPQEGRHSAAERDVTTAGEPTAKRQRTK